MTQLNTSMVTTYMDHTVSPTATKILIHWIQIYKAKRPQTYLSPTNATEPLEYMPELVTIPMMLVSGTGTPCRWGRMLRGWITGSLTWWSI